LETRPPSPVEREKNPEVGVELDHPEPDARRFDV
jgi:hypothetical protein